MKKILGFCVAMGLFTLSILTAHASEPFALTVSRIGISGTNMRFVIPNSCLPVGISAEQLVGAKVNGTMQYVASEEGKGDLTMVNNEIVNFEPGGSTSVLVIASNDAVSASMVDDGSGKYLFNLTVTPLSEANANERTVQVNFKRGGSSTYVRLVVATSEIPTDIDASYYAGAQITGTLTHKTDPTLSLTLDNEINSIEIGETETVLNVKDSETFSKALFKIGSQYTGTLTITVSIPEKPENTVPVPLNGTTFYVPASYFHNDLGSWAAETDNNLAVVAASNKTDTPNNCTTLIDVPKDGAYRIYALSKNLTESNSGLRNYKVQVNNILFSTTLGTHKNEGWQWEYVGKIDLKHGKNTVELYSEKTMYGRCGGLMFTTEADFEPISPAYVAETLKNYSVPAISAVDLSHVYTSGLNLSFYIKNRTENALKNTWMVAAIYDKDGNLVDVKSQKFDNIDAYSNTEKINIVFQPTSPWQSGKIILLKSASSLQPLTQFCAFDYQDPDFSVPETGGESYGSISNTDWRLTEYYEKEANVRSGIPNAWSKLESGQPLTVAFVGGSVTEQYKWCESVLRWMRQKFPNATITDHNIGLSGTGTWVGAIRMDKDILALNPDLIFIEYGGNGGTSPQMEGIFRKIWTYNPNIDIVMVNTMHADWYQTYKNGLLPDNIARFEQIAQHYGIPSASFGVQVAEYYDQGKLTLSGNAEQDKILYAKDGIHPTADGGQLAGGAVVRSLIRMSQVNKTPTAHTLPEPMFEDNWEKASSVAFNDMSKIKFEGNWFDCTNNGTDGKYGDNYEYTGGYVYMFKKIFNEGMKGTKTAGDTFTVKFIGRTVGIFEAGGQYSGQLKVTVDGVPQENLVLYCSYDSKPRHQLYYLPNIEYGEHTVTFELDSTMPDKSANQSQNPNDTVYEKNELYIGRIVSDGEILNINE